MLPVLPFAFLQDSVVLLLGAGGDRLPLVLILVMLPVLPFAFLQHSVVLLLSVDGDGLSLVLILVIPLLASIDHAFVSLGTEAPSRGLLVLLVILLVMLPVLPFAFLQDSVVLLLGAGGDRLPLVLILVMLPV